MNRNGIKVDHKFRLYRGGVMKCKWITLFITFLFFILSSSGFAQIIYSNSFEYPNDTTGWTGYLQFRHDAPPNGGNQSVYISGGCIWPHASVELDPSDENGFYIIRCWGKDLQIGGEVLINVEGEASDQVNILINQKEWKFYESKKMLYCPADKKIILSMGAGGIVASAMLVDKIEIVRVNEAGSWFIRNSGTKEKLNDVVMLDSSTAIIAGSEGSILKTTDSGETWSNTSPKVYCTDSIYCIMKWNSVVFYDKLNGIVAGQSSIVLTSDGGENWQFLNIPSGNNFTCIGKTSLNNIYVGDDSGYVYRSIDTGKSWTSERLTSSPVRSIYPFKANPLIFGLYEKLIFALTPNSLFVKNLIDTSSWRNWGPLGYFQGLGSGAFKGEYSEDGTAFIVGVQGDLVSQAAIIRLRPFDSHWYSVGPANEFEEFHGLSIPSSSIIYTCGSNGKILKSTNSGDNWFSLKTPTIQNLNSVCFFDDERGFAVGDSGTIMFTSEGGISNGNSSPYPFHLLLPADEDTMLVMRSISFSWQKAIDPDDDPVHYTLLISSDSCATWNSYGPVTDTTRIQVQSPAQTPGRYFWTVIANDGILATPSLDVFAFTIKTAAGVNKDKMPDKFILHQNYPNPFNPSTVISYEIPADENVEIKIFDATGREIATLINEYQRAGNYKVKWNAGNFASGVYFYSIKTKDFYSTKKLIFLK